MSSDISTKPDVENIVRIAVIGCAHGELEAMYDACKEVEQKDGRKVDLILCCGDFESIRNENDLACMACPPKYRDMVTFWKYYSGECVAPIPTIFIHGNHEASNYLMELPYGGWVAPNVYYMGFAGIVNFAGIRIGGYGGIFKRGDFQKGRYEVCPLNDATMRSLYHCREYEMFQLLQVTAPIDIMLSHDWPISAATAGDTQSLLRKKPFFKDEIERGELGNPAHDKLIDILKPSYWFSAHLHVKHAALMGAGAPDTHTGTHTHSTTGNREGDEGERMEHHVHSVQQGYFTQPDGKTRFLALDKIIPGRDFMQILDFPARIAPKPIPTAANISETENSESSEIPKLGLVNSRFDLEFDVEWLSIVKSTQCFYPREVRANMPNRNNPVIFPTEIDCSENNSGIPRFDFRATEEELSTVRNLIGSFKIPDNFIMTAPHYSGGHYNRTAATPTFQFNPQTVQLCRRLKLAVPCFDGRRKWVDPNAEEILQLERQLCDNYVHFAIKWRNRERNINASMAASAVSVVGKGTYGKGSLGMGVHEPNTTSSYPSSSSSSSSPASNMTGNPSIDRYLAQPHGIPPPPPPPPMPFHAAMQSRHIDTGAGTGAGTGTGKGVSATGKGYCDSEEPLSDDDEGGQGKQGEEEGEGEGDEDWGLHTSIMNVNGGVGSDGGVNGGVGGDINGLTHGDQARRGAGGVGGVVVGATKRTKTATGMWQSDDEEEPKRPSFSEFLKTVKQAEPSTQLSSSSSSSMATTTVTSTSTSAGASGPTVTDPASRSEKAVSLFGFLPPPTRNDDLDDLLSGDTNEDAFILGISGEKGKNSSGSLFGNNSLFSGVNNTGKSGKEEDASSAPNVKRQRID